MGSDQRSGSEAALRALSVTLVRPDPKTALPKSSKAKRKQSPSANRGSAVAAARRKHLALIITQAAAASGLSSAAVEEVLDQTGLRSAAGGQMSPDQAYRLIAALRRRKTLTGTRIPGALPARPPTAPPGAATAPAAGGVGGASALAKAPAPPSPVAAPTSRATPVSAPAPGTTAPNGAAGSRRAKSSKRDRRQKELHTLTALLARPLQRKPNQTAGAARRLRTNAVLAQAVMGTGLTLQQVERIVDRLKMRSAITGQMSPAEVNRLLTALTGHPKAVPVTGPLPLMPVTDAGPAVLPKSTVSSTRLSLRTTLGVDDAVLALVLAACGMRNAGTAERFDPEIAGRITTTARRLIPLADELLDAPLFEPTAHGIITPAQLPLADTPRWAQLARLGLLPSPTQAAAHPGRRWPQVAGYAQALALRRSALPAEPDHSPAPTGTTPAVASPGAGPAAVVAFPGCEHLLKTGRHLQPVDVAALYTALGELTFYHSDPQIAAIRHIAAEKFGIHASAPAGRAIREQAARTVADGRARDRLEDLTRLARRPFGLFYDDHRRRIILWESNDSGAVLLYTTTLDEVLARARQAVDTGVLVPPAVTRTAAWPGMEQTTADNPGLVLAEVAYHLGTLTPRSHRPDKSTASAQRTFPEITGPRGELVDYARLDWLVPLAGPMGAVHLNLPRGTFDRDPRRRPAPHQVREHRRRAPGSPPTAVPDVRVKGYITGIGGPLKPTVTTTTTRNSQYRP